MSDWGPSKAQQAKDAAAAVQTDLSTHYTTSADQKITDDEIKQSVTDSLVTAKTYSDGLITTEVTNRNSAIDLKADSITSSVAETYTTKSDFNALQVGGTNLLFDSKFDDASNAWNFTLVGTNSVTSRTFESDARHVITPSTGNQNNGELLRFNFFNTGLTRAF